MSVEVEIWQGRATVLKRLVRPQPGDPHEVTDPAGIAYWRREADVALDGALEHTLGVRAASVLGIEEDEDGITLRTAEVADAEVTGPFLAAALGRFSTNRLEARPWWVRDLLAQRLARVEHRGGWPTLRRTTLADVADRLWERRGHHLRRLAARPQVPMHGDATPANLRGRVDDEVVGLDWASFGLGPLGADAGYLALSVREDLTLLSEAYAAAGHHDHEPVLDAAVVTAVYTALTRTEWALARVAAGEGALAGKYRHPSVAPYIRSLQRLLPQVESLL